MDKYSIELNLDFGDIAAKIESAGRGESKPDEVSEYLKNILVNGLERLEWKPNRANSKDFFEILYCQMYPDTLLTEILREDCPVLASSSDASEENFAERNVGLFARRIMRSEIHENLTLGARKIDRHLIEKGAYNEHPVLD